MAYCSASDVAAYCPQLLDGASTFSGSTKPTDAQVTKFMTSGCALINNALTAKGYTPPASGTAAYEQLNEINALYAAAIAEMTRTNQRLAPGERTRGQVFQKMFRDELAEFLAQDLSRAGLSYTTAGYVGGISETEKDNVNDDSDRVPNRFTTGQFDNA